METVKPIDFTAQREEFSRFIMAYKFALDEVVTKINILKQEFEYIHDYNPIEHVSSRLKSPKSILSKAQRIDCPMELHHIKEQMFDIAGVRITCSFIDDVYRIQDMLARQRDIEVLDVKDYVAEPKKNGYQSLHLIIRTPVHMSDRVEDVTVEIQIRTIAMDFWASLEHKIYYKYDQKIPQRMLDQLRDAAVTARELDKRMQDLHAEVVQIKRDREIESFSKEETSLPAAAEILAAFMPPYTQVNSAES